MTFFLRFCLDFSSVYVDILIFGYKDTCYNYLFWYSSLIALLCL